MRSIVYSVYRNGSAGLSNLIMSVELGVVLASLTDRLLVLKGNKTPTANVVQYAGLVHNRYPSRVTDLVDLGVPWTDWDEIFAGRYAAQEIGRSPPWECVFYFPPHLSIDSQDFRSFAKDRSSAITIGDDLEHIPALSYSAGKSNLTLGYYSSFFYLGRSAQIQAFDALRKMQPKPEIAAFADKIAGDLGAFNAVHIRRGDFKLTKGVTTLERTATEAIAALDNHFRRDEQLVILTDEADDPFFDEIRKAYTRHIFLDHHILHDYGPEFSDLPAHDSIALAYISQLVAAHSRDFIGTMTSTFTGLIQRMRGNLGKEESFKYLWNELPPVGAKVEPGRHVFGDDIRLKKGVMVEDQDGPYTWNRVNQRLNLSWMREWPESFLNENRMVERAGNRELALVPDTLNKSAETSETRPPNLPCQISFLDSTVSLGSDDPGISKSMRDLFALMSGPSVTPTIGEVRIAVHDEPATLLVDGKVVGKGNGGAKLLRRGYREVVRLFIHQHPELVWIHAASAADDGGAIVLPGTWGRGKSSLILELHRQGWSFLSDDIVPLNPIAGKAIPFPGTPQVRPGSQQALSREQLAKLSKSAVPLSVENVATQPEQVSSIVFPQFVSNADTTLTEISPAQAVAELLENCLSFPNNDDASINALCRMVEDVPAHSLKFGDVADAARLLIEAHKSR